MTSISIRFLNQTYRVSLEHLEYSTKSSDHFYDALCQFFVLYGAWQLLVPIHFPHMDERRSDILLYFSTCVPRNKDFHVNSFITNYYFQSIDMTSCLKCFQNRIIISNQTKVLYQRVKWDILHPPAQVGAETLYFSCPVFNIPIMYCWN